MESRTVRLAYLVSHPVQYQAPLLRRIAAEPGIDLTVFFCSDFSLRAYRDAGFGAEVAWDTPLTDGYRHHFLPRIRDTHSPGATRPIAFGILRALNRGRFDALWVHGYASLNSMHGILAANALGIPVLLRNDGWLGDRARSASTLWRKQLFFAALEKLTDATLSIGTHNAAYWREYFGNRVPSFLLPYAVDNAWFADRAALATPQRDELCRELNLDPDRPVILYASKLQKRKLCGDLLDAYLGMRPSPNEDPHPYLVIVGDGEERSDLEARVAQSGCTSIRFAGFRNQTELPRFFDLCSVFVLPARHEPWGLIVNEVMACGRPVIVSSDVGAAPDLVRNGETGFVYPVGDIAALRSALDRVLASPAEAERMGQNAQRHIRDWNFEADVRGLSQALAAITGKGPAA